jgi:hypothetical protein
MRNLGILSISAGLLFAVHSTSWGQSTLSGDRPSTLPPPASQPARTYDMKQAAYLTDSWKKEASPAADDTACCPEPPKFGIVLFGDAQYIAARGADVSYVRAMDGCTALAVPKGPVGMVQPTYAGGFRLGGEVAIDCESSVRATFGWYDSKAHDFTTVGHTNNVLRALLTHPSTVNCTANSLDADAALDIGYMTGDIDYHRFWFHGANYYIDWLAGIRLAHQKQDFHTDYEVLGTTSVDTRIRFDGVGPRVGLEGERIGSCGFLVYGRTSASLLMSHVNASYAQDNNFIGPQASTSIEDNRIIPVLELELGVGWTSCSGRISVKAGYYVGAWFNMMLTPDFIQGVQGANFTTNGDNLRNVLTFDGLTARLEFTF